LGASVAESVSAGTLRLTSLAQGQPRDPLVAWLMVPHSVVDDVLKELTPNLQKGDIIIDGGNSFYKDSIRRGEELQKLGVHYIDVGVSGGPSGARNGACLMIGGEKSTYKTLVGLFSDISVAGGYDYMGELGAGHFVKMVHNGIEYGMMQAIAEGFAVMQKWREGLDLERIAHLYNNGSVIESRLVHWLKEAYRIHGTELNDISGTVAHSGEGDWTVEASKELDIPVPVIQAALQFRIDSEKDPSYTGQIVSALRNQFGGHSVSK
ncbi:MAG: phosphogluconate dehydrogenase (NAD(+)-dependent, decarboxylating), partial [Candidatus Andersenbacteria bacterium]